MAWSAIAQLKISRTGGKANPESDTAKTLWPNEECRFHALAPTNDTKSSRRRANDIVNTGF